jgi:hypothetical protein
VTLVGRIARWFASAALAIAAFVFLGSYAIYFFMHQMPFMGTTFSPAAWAEAGDCSGLGDGLCQQKWTQCKRGAMYRSLTRNHLSIGKTRKADAAALLGSDHTSYQKGNCARYVLGYCSGIGADIDFGELCYDGNDLLNSFRHFQG